jgi:hypothetical protein
MSEISDTETDVGGGALINNSSSNELEHITSCPCCIKRICKTYLESKLLVELKLNSKSLELIDKCIDKYKFSIRAIKSIKLDLQSKNITDENVYNTVNTKENKYTKKISLFNSKKDNLKIERNIIIKIINKYDESYDSDEDVSDNESNTEYDSDSDSDSDIEK